MNTDHRSRTLRLALEQAEKRLCESLHDPVPPGAELISLFVEDIARLRLEEQQLRDRAARPARLGCRLKAAFHMRRGKRRIAS